MEIVSHASRAIAKGLVRWSLFRPWKSHPENKSHPVGQSSLLVSVSASGARDTTPEWLQVVRHKSPVTFPRANRALAASYVPANETRSSQNPSALFHMK